MNSMGKSVEARTSSGSARRLTAALSLALLTPWLAMAGSEGLPVAHTGAFGEQSCDRCHRNTLGGLVRSVEIDVGPYVPDAPAQRVVVNIIDPAARAWGFQLTARRANNTSMPAGSFAPPSAPGSPSFVRVRCADTELPPPCNGNVLQYVTHNAAGAQRGPASIMQFFVDWTAPNTDVGDVIFNVAAMGADGDRGTNGDRVATAQAVSLYAPSNTPQLNTNGAVNAAAPSGPGRSISPLALISIFGTKLAAPNTSRPVQSTDLDTQDRIPTELNRVSVEFTSPPSDLIPRLGRILFVGDNQINLQAPDFYPTSGDTVEIRAVINRGKAGNEIRSNPITAQIRQVAPAIFTLSEQGTGDAAAVHANGQLVTPANPARPGEVIAIYGNGFGRTSPPFDAGVLPSSAANLSSDARADIGGMNAVVHYKGVAPGFAGLYQFNVQIPASGLSAGNHAIFIHAGSFVTQPGVTIPVGP
jgi:uncharacterized protein (TIGR03437 family)